MNDIACDLCGVDLPSRSERFGDKEITLCEQCYKTEDIFENNEVLKESVIVTDFNMPFFSMVLFMVKWAIASIPAMIILFVAFSIMSIFIGGMFL